MNWTKLLYVLMIVLLYIPMVFLGANIFFPKYTGMIGNYQYKDCYSPCPEIKQNFSEYELNKTIDICRAKQNECLNENNIAQTKFEDEKNSYNGMKYVFIALFNLAILLFALFVTLQDSVTMGLFLASICASFGATIGYFGSKSKIGFVILLATFFVMIYFINKKKDTFIDWKTKDDKKKRRR